MTFKIKIIRGEFPYFFTCEECLESGENNRLSPIFLTTLRLYPQDFAPLTANFMIPIKLVSQNSPALADNSLSGYFLGTPLLSPSHLRVAVKASSSSKACFFCSHVLCLLFLCKPPAQSPLPANPTIWSPSPPSVSCQGMLGPSALASKPALRI